MSGGPRLPIRAPRKLFLSNISYFKRWEFTPPSNQPVTTTTLRLVLWANVQFGKGGLFVLFHGVTVLTVTLVRNICDDSSQGTRLRLQRPSTYAIALEFRRLLALDLQFIVVKRFENKSVQYNTRMPRVVLFYHIFSAH